MKKFISLFVICVLFSQLTILAQVKTEKDEEFKAKIVDYLMETARETNNLASSGNRLLFSTEVASLLWEYDEKEARNLFTKAMNDVRQQMSGFNSQVVGEELSVETDSLAQYGISSNTDFARIIAARQTVTMDLAEFDPQTALDFYFETKQLITSPRYYEQIEKIDKYNETKLLELVATKDPSKALEFGRKMIQDGVSYQNINFLQEFYKKDAEKAHALAEEMLAKIKQEKSSSENLENAKKLLDLATAKVNEKAKLKLDKPLLLDDSQIRELADVIAKNLLALNKEDVEDSYRYEIKQYLAVVEKYSPAKATQIRQKFGIKQEYGSVKSVSVKAMPMPVPTPKPRGTGSAITAKTNPNDEEMLKLMSKLGKEKLTSEERDKIKTEMMQKLAKTRRREEKLMLLVGFITQFNQVGEKELAEEFIGEIKGLVNPMPKNYLEHTTNLTLASALAEIDSDKSFELLESSIFQINDVINGGLKVVEFIDIRNELFADGELQLNFGPAGGLIREASQMLPFVSTMIPVLARKDFERTKSLANKFERPEAKFLARIIILRSLIKAKDTAKKKAVSEDINYEYEDLPPPPTPKPTPIPKKF